MGRSAMVAGGVLCLLGVAAPSLAQFTVSPGNLGPWQEQNTACAGSNTGSTGFENGPGTPPLGTGSGRLAVGGNGDSFNTFRYTGLDAVLLAQLTELRYGTYVQTPGSGSEAPYVILDVDLDGDATFENQLFSEPANQGTVTPGGWQSWNALTGSWSLTLGGATFTLASYIATNPTARIVNTGTGDGGFRVASGCGGAGWVGFVGNFDAVAIGVNDKTTTFNFEGQLPEISIDDVAELEGTGGTHFMTFTVSLSSPAPQDVAVSFTTTPGTALAGSDYVPASGTVTIPQQTSTAPIAVEVVTDANPEADETFTVDLSNPQGATILDGQGLGTIQNDDGVPTDADLSIAKTGPASVGLGANVTYTITVSNLGPLAASNVTVTDPIPPGTTWLSATPSQGSCSGTTTVTCTLGAIANGGSATISLVVQAPNGPASFTNTATVTNTPELDPVVSNNAATSAPTQVTGGVVQVPTLSSRGALLLMLGLAGVALRRLR
jgi:uncharacterized repeat protein (TIGR01451 family)